MDIAETVRQFLLVAHFLGLAAVLGAFLFQLKRKTGFEFRVMLIGAIVQLVTGLLLVGVRQVSDLGVDNAKVAVKLLVTIVVLVAVLVAQSRQKRGLAAGTTDHGSLPWLHIAGVSAIANVFVAVLW